MPSASSVGWQAHALKEPRKRASATTRRKAIGARLLTAARKRHFSIASQRRPLEDPTGLFQSNFAGRAAIGYAEMEKLLT